MCYVLWASPEFCSRWIKAEHVGHLPGRGEAEAAHTKHRQGEEIGLDERTGQLS